MTSATYRLLKEMPLSKLQGEHFHEIKDTATVKDALDLFAKHQVSSAAVVDDEGDVWGKIDTLDLVAYAARKLDEELSGRELTPDKITSFLTKQPVRKLMDISGRNHWQSIPRTRSVLKALHVLAFPSNHRIFLTDEQGMPCGVISQVDILKFILENRQIFENRLSERVGGIWPVEREVIGIRDSESVLEAFKEIFLNKVTGLGVVDDNGTLVGNISANDIRNIKFSEEVPEKLFSILHETSLRDFISKRAKQEEVFVDNMVPHLQPVVVNKNDTLGTVLEKAIEEKVHRIFVLNEEHKPIDVITTGDMVAQFWQ